MSENTASQSAPVEGMVIAVGGAYLCSDGLVRWVESQSETGRIRAFWRLPNCDVWGWPGEYDISTLESLASVAVRRVDAPKKTYKLRRSNSWHIEQQTVER